MPGSVFDLLARLTIDTTKYEEGLANSKSLANRVGSGIKAGLGAIATAAAGAFAAASAATTKFVSDAVKTGLDFDSSMSQVAATMGKTVDEMLTDVQTVEIRGEEFTGNLRDYALKMGKETAFSAKEAADALNYMALAGYDTVTSMQMLPNVLNLAAAGGFDLATASDMVTDAQTAFGISLERTSQMVNEMAKAASTGNTSVQQLGDAFLTVGGLAAELNGGVVKLDDGTTKAVDGVQELEIALTAMANAGVKGTEAGTHMRNMLLRLSSPTSEGTKALEDMGVAIFDTSGNMRSLSEIFGDLSQNLDEMTQEQKIQTISELFNARDLSSAEALLKAMDQDWNRIGASILEAEGSAQQMANVQLDNLTGDMTLFKSALDNAKITISDALSPTLREFVQLGTEGLTQLADAFTENGLQGAIDALPTLLDKAIEKVNNVIPKAIEVVGKVADAIAKNLPGMVDSILPPLLVALLDVSDTVIKTVPELVRAFGSAVAKALSGDTLDTVFEALDGLIDGLIELAKDAFTSENVQRVVSWVTDFILRAVDFVKNNLPGLVGLATEIVTTLVDALSNVDYSAWVEAAVDLVIVFVDAIINNLDGILLAAQTLITTLLEELTKPEMLEKLISAGTTILAKLVEGLLSSLGSVLAFIGETTNVISKGFVEYDWAGLGLTIVNGIADGLLKVDAIREAVDGFAEVWASGYVTIEDFVNNVADLWQTGWDTLVNFGGKIYDAIEGFKKKWSEFWDNINTRAANLGMKLVDNVEGTKKRLVERVTNLASSIRTKVTEIKTNITNTLSNILTATVNRATSIRNGITNAINSAVQAIKSLPQQALSWGRDMVQNFVNGITSTVYKVAQAAGDIAGAIASYIHFSEPDIGPLSDFHTYAPDMIDTFVEGVRSNKAKLDAAMNELLDTDALDVVANVTMGELPDMDTPKVFASVVETPDAETHRTSTEDTSNAYRGGALDAVIDILRDILTALKQGRQVVLSTDAINRALGQTQTYTERGEIA